MTFFPFKIASTRLLLRFSRLAASLVGPLALSLPLFHLLWLTYCAIAVDLLLQIPSLGPFFAS